jgi:PPM family protein phosphatase
MPIVCPACATTNAPDSTFCVRCGAPLAPGDPEAARVAPAAVENATPGGAIGPPVVLTAAPAEGEADQAPPEPPAPPPPSARGEPPTLVIESLAALERPGAAAPPAQPDAPAPVVAPVEAEAPVVPAPVTESGAAEQAPEAGGDTIPLPGAPAPVPAGLTPQDAPTEILPFDLSVLHPLPDGAILAGRYVVRGLIQHAPQLNLYRAQARNVQRCPHCGALAAPDAPVCARCQAALTGAAPLPAYVVAEARDRDALLRDPTVIERGLQHPNLMPLVDEFSYAPYGPARAYTVAETRQGVPLAQLPPPQPAAQVVGWGLQLTEALRYLHEQGVLSPGATPGNVLIQDNEAVLANLQQARPASPDPRERGREFAADVTALAGLLYATLTGHAAPAADQGPLLPDSAPPALETAFARALRPGPDSPPLTAEGWHDLLAQAREALHAPAPSLRIRSGRISDVGRHRPLNEDSLGVIECQVVQESVSAGVGVYAVADGMGGHAGGEVASALAIATVTDTLVRRFIAPQFNPSSVEPSNEQITGWLADAVQAANGRIHLERTQRGTDMGTTLVVALLTPQKLYIANVGDSRAYLWTPGGDSGGALRQVSVDHSLVQRLVTMGQITPEEAKYHPYRNMIYKSLGERAQVETDLFVEAVVPGLRLLLCSDGLSGMVPDPQIAEILAAEADPQAACARLIAAANEAGGTDNITAITIYVEATGDARNTDSA